MKLQSLSLFLLCCVTLAAKVSGQVPPQSQAASFDVTHYDAQVEPDIANKTIKGKVLIRFVSRAENLQTIEFDCGELTIDAVSEKGEGQKFTLGQHRMSITARLIAECASFQKKSRSIQSSRQANGCLVLTRPKTGLRCD